MTFVEFQTTRQEMSARRFGEIIQDVMWDDEEGEKLVFLVYDNGWYIQKEDDGRYCLTIENQSWITGPNLSLEDLERELYHHADKFSGL